MQRAYKGVPSKDIPLPTHKWAAFQIQPTQVEFWRYGSNNLHLRHRYSKEAQGWSCVILDS